MHPLYKTRFTRWHDLEEVIEQLPTSTEKGDAFEEFVFFYFEQYRSTYQIEEHYCPVAQKAPFPKKVKDALKLETKDYGVDGVYITTSGEYTAYQCKFRSNRNGLSYADLATFWGEAEYADYRCTVTNAATIPHVADKKIGHMAVLPSHFDQLGPDFFALLHDYAISSEIKKKPRKVPRDYQKEILESLNSGLNEHDRGKFIAACGIGKTLISLWLMELRDPQTVLFLAPSLQLIRQTLGEWADEAGTPFDYLCVCSDTTVALEDENTLDLSEVDVPVTTDSDTISKFLSKKTDRRRIIFSTYQSVPVLAEGIAAGDFGEFDLAIYDEAHRTASGGNSGLFSVALDDAVVPCKKRLFMTATERVVKAHLKEAAERADDVVFSMDDEKLYGPTLFRLSFGEAIDRGIISDYRLVFAGTHSQEIGELVEANKYVKPDGAPVGALELAQSIYRRLLLVRCIQDLGCSKTVTFHSKVSEAQVFAKAMADDLGGDVAVHHVNGSMSSSKRTELIGDFERAGAGILTNVRCLTEGVDIPLIDSVFFANPRGSLIDIVQAVGRALRQPFGFKGKLAYIIIPILLDESTGDSMVGPGFDTLYNVIQALRDQDENLAEWIDGINLGAVTGKSISSGGGSKLQLILPPTINLENLSEALLLKIADVNKDPSDHQAIGSKLGKTERKSAYTRVFKTLCDYTPEKLESSLVAPTLALMEDIAITYDSADVRLNNNNVSHCLRLGVIEALENRRFRLTPLGMAYKAGDISFTSLFKNQMLKYADASSGNRLFPYRIAFEFMREVKSLGFRDFIYTLYSVQVDSKGVPNTEEIIRRAVAIQKDFPNTELTSEANKGLVLEKLNGLHPVGFTYNDVWTDRTTTGNQFRYVMRHLELFKDLFRFDGPTNKLLLVEGQEQAVSDYLALTEGLLVANDYGSARWTAEGGSN